MNARSKLEAAMTNFIHYSTEDGMDKSDIIRDICDIIYEASPLEILLLNGEID